MTDKQMSFVEPSWGVGDYVTINGQHGQIKVFDAIKGKVMVEHFGPDNEKFNRNYPITDLPPYTPPVSKTPDEPQPDGAEESVQDDDVAESPPASPVSAGAEVEVEIDFVKGHKRVDPALGKLIVDEPSVKGKYMVRVFPKSGGSYPTEKTWQDIRDWGEEVVESSSQDKSVAAMVEKLEAAKDEMEKHSPPPPVPAPVKPRREMRCACFIERDQDGFHNVEASKTLTALINDGWTLQHVERQSMWIPAGSIKKTSYVETVLYWTLSRVAVD